MKIVIIGAGAAGLMAAANISAPTVLLEHSEKAGKKLYITGKGRCNITNDCPPDVFLKNVVNGERFLQGAINRFPPAYVMEFFENNGLPLKTERGRRVFPLSDKASDVTKTLVKCIEKANSEIHYFAHVSGIRPENDGFDIYYEENYGNSNDDILDSGSNLDSCRIQNKALGGKSKAKETNEKGAKRKIHAGIVIVAAGGKSYPSTGSDGNFFNILKSLGHSITDMYPSLVPYVVREDMSSLKGISLKNVVVTGLYSQGLDKSSSSVCVNNDIKFGTADSCGVCSNCTKQTTKKEKMSAEGELLFTDKGISGPVVLTLSAMLARQRVTELRVDLMPSASEDSLNTKLLAQMDMDRTRAIKNILSGLLPKSLAWYILKDIGLDPDKKAAVVSKTERLAIVSAIKGLRLCVERTGSFSEAVVTSGGVSLKEIDPKTMESKLHKGIYVIGEALDIDAFTGGYNLQLAWSTALACAESINKRLADF